MDHQSYIKLQALDFLTWQKSEFHSPSFNFLNVKNLNFKIPQLLKILTLFMKYNIQIYTNQGYSGDYEMLKYEEDCF